MDKRERFKVAVLALCADQGLSLGETLTLLKEANQARREKTADWSQLATTPLSWLWRALVFGPPIAGGVGGWGLARMTSGINDSTPAEVKHREMIQALRQQTSHARSQTELAQRRKTRESERGRGLL